jgi:squalene cyclase
VARAVGWLKKQQPSTAEDRSFRLLGLTWGNADEASRRRAVTDILDHQRADGGWSQRDELASDAYATGLTMHALQSSARLANTEGAMRRGAAYLLATQRADGSWFVASRSPKFQPYFEGGFPYGPNQWISSMATGWATAALAGGLQAGLAN